MLNGHSIPHLMPYAWNQVTWGFETLEIGHMWTETNLNPKDNIKWTQHFPRRYSCVQQWHSQRELGERGWLRGMLRHHRHQPRHSPHHMDRAPGQLCIEYSCVLCIVLSKFIRLQENGNKYAICGLGNGFHCSSGNMKLNVTINNC